MADLRQVWRYRDERLDNGLRVITLEEHHSPIVSVQVWYHVGSKNEDPERQGFAHMFEHIMFRGSDRIGPQDHFKYLQQYGGRVNGYTSFDETVYWETLPARQLDLALWLEAERMGRLRIDEEYFKAEREVVKEELRMRVLNKPYGSIREQIHAAAYHVHPYRWTPIGVLDHLNAATADELRIFFKTYYVPNNATLVVVGDVTHEEVMSKARRYLGGVPRMPDPPRVMVVEPPMAGPRRLETTDKAPSPLAACIFHSPGARDVDALVMDVLADILGAGQSSRLYRQLVQSQEMAVNVSAYNRSLEQGGLFVLSATLKPGVTAEQGEKALLDEIHTLLEKGVRLEEVEKARNQEVASYVQFAETVQGRAGQLGYAAVVLDDIGRVNTDLDRLRTITVDQVMSAARRVLADTNRLSVLVRPADKTATAPAEVADKSGIAKEPVRDWPRPKEMPTAGSPRPVNVPLPEMAGLPNGLRIMVVSDPSTPAVTVGLNALVGAREDPDGKAGLADVVMSTLRRGTLKHTGDQLAEIIDYHGMSVSESVDYEDVGIQLWTLTEYLALGVETLSEIVRTPSFPEKEVAGYVSRSVARRAIEEKDPSTVADRVMARELFGKYFLARPLDGTSASLAAIKRDAVVDFHRRYITPDVSCLIFAGDITKDQALALATRWFGDWEGKAERNAAGVMPVSAPTHIALVDQPDAAQSEIRIGQVVSLSRRDLDYPAARLLSQIFGASFSSRLNRVLRIEKGLTYHAGGYFDLKSEAASLKVTTFTRTDRTADAIKTILAEIDRLRRPNNITEDELTSARDTLVGSFQVELETPARIAGLHWNLLIWGLPPTWYNTYLGQLDAISDPSAVVEVAVRRIDPALMTAVVVGRGAELAEGLSTIAPVTKVAGEQAAE